MICLPWIPENYEWVISTHDFDIYYDYTEEEIKRSKKKLEDGSPVTRELIGWISVQLREESECKISRAFSSYIRTIARHKDVQTLVDLLAMRVCLGMLLEGEGNEPV